MSDLAKFPGLMTRKGSRNWSYRAVIPEDLQETYGKREIVRSLGTEDRKEAERAWLEVRYERNVRRLLGSARLAGIPFTFENLPQYLREVRVDARERMNCVLAPLDMEPLEDDEDHRSIFELVGDVVRSCGERTDLIPVILERRNLGAQRFVLVRDYLRAGTQMQNAEGSHER